MKLKIVTILFFFLIYQNLFGVDKKDSDPKKIRTGYSIYLFKDVDIRDATVAIKMWADELLNKLGMDFFPEAKIYESTGEIVTALNKNELELISISTLDYFEIENKAEVEPSLITTINGNPGDNFILVARKDGNYKSILDLKGKVLLKPGGTYGKIIDVWITNLISNKTTKHITFLSSVRTVEKPSQALLPVFFKQADACVITENSYLTMIELNPQLQKDLSIIEISPTYPNGLMCLNKNIDSELKNKIVTAAKSLSNTVSGKQILTLFKAENVVEFDENYLREIRAAYNNYKKIINVK